MKQGRVEIPVNRNWTRRLALAMLVLATGCLGGCSGNVGVGVNVGVPIGNHGYMSIGTGRWY
jgi:hypothetical protein